MVKMQNKFILIAVHNLLKSLMMHIILNMLNILRLLIILKTMMIKSVNKSFLRRSGIDHAFFIILNN